MFRSCCCPPLADIITTGFRAASPQSQEITCSVTCSIYPATWARPMPAPVCLPQRAPMAEITALPGSQRETLPLLPNRGSELPALSAPSPSQPSAEQGLLQQSRRQNSEQSVSSAETQMEPSPGSPKTHTHGLGV